MCLKGYLRFKTALFVGSVLVAAPLVYYFFFYESEEGITYDMVEQFAKGVDGLTQKDLVASVKRDELRAHLRMIVARLHYALPRHFG